MPTLSRREESEERGERGEKMTQGQAGKGLTLAVVVRR